MHRWVIKLVPLFEKQFRKNRRPVGKSWRMDESYIKIKGDGPGLSLALQGIIPPQAEAMTR